MTEAELREVDGMIGACGRGPDALVPFRAGDRMPWRLA